MFNSILQLLIIDDDKIDRLAIKRALRSANIETEIQESINVEDGVQILNNNYFDCIFMDYQLPDGDGLAFLKEIRDKQIETPVIFLTGQGDEDLAVNAIQAGASHYIPKSRLSKEVIKESLFHVLRVYRAEKDKKEAELKLQITNKQIVSILESITDAFFAVDSDWNITFANSQANLIFCDNATILENNLWDVLCSPDEWFVSKLKSCMISQQSVNMEGYYSHINRWLNVHIYPSHENMSIYFNDITEKKEAETRLNYLASHDLLTDLPNRAMLMDRLTQALTRVVWHKRCVGIMFIDLDRFKQVNDSFGHSIGDELLITMAKRIQSIIRAGDTVARIGGDEFVVILSDLAHKDHAADIAHKIQNIIADPMQLGPHTLQVTASIGMSFYPYDGDTVDKLLRNADTAMYNAKSANSDNIVSYAPEMTINGSKQMLIELNLRHEKILRELRLLYQPIVNLNTKELRGFESLVRWHNPELGLLNPMQFLPIAEEIGVMNKLGTWIMNSACDQAKSLQKLIMSVNISASEFRSKDFYNRVVESIETSGIKPECLELELTENIVIQEFDESISILKKLRDLGVNLALDDFGTGYSSLAYLKRLPLTTLKIDRSFITDICGSRQSASIVCSIIDLAHCLNLNVVAEGVEGTNQLDKLTEFGCDLVQGNMINAPMDSQDLGDFRVSKTL